MLRRASFIFIIASALSSAARGELVTLFANDFAVDPGAAVVSTGYTFGQTTATGISSSATQSETFLTAHNYSPVQWADDGSEQSLQVKGLGPDAGGINPSIQFFSASSDGLQTASSNRSQGSSALRNSEDYVQFQIGVEDGHAVEFNDFQYDSTLSTTTVQPDVVEFRSSLDSYASVIGTAALDGETQIDLTGMGLNHVTSDIQFRLYIQYSEQAANTGGLAIDDTCFALNRFAFNGTVTAVPEPGSCVHFAAMALAIVMPRRRQLHRSDR